MENLNLLFNKTYYDKLGAKDIQDIDIIFKKNNNAMFRTKMKLDNCESPDYQESLLNDQPGFQVVHMETLYPGMMIGTGYMHGSNQGDNDINMGFSFDYTTGQPYIPGSTVKGVLKSYFRQEIVNEILGKDLSIQDVNSLKEEIFESGKDIFLDAVLYKSNHIGKDGQRDLRILGDDYITPHSNPIKNPVPIKMIKVLPGVIFEFRFILTDSTILTADEKIKLFSYLLETFGIGAKTNVGYGALKAVKE